MRWLLALLAMACLASGCAAVGPQSPSAPGLTQSTDWRIDTFSGFPSRQSL